jgi:transposase
VDRQRTGGSVDACEAGPRGGSRLDAHEDFIIGMIEDEKDITLNEMVLRLHEDRAVSIGRSALDVWLRKRGWTFKNVWPAPLAIGLLMTLLGRAQTYPA